MCSSFKDPFRVFPIQKKNKLKVKTIRKKNTSPLCVTCVSTDSAGLTSNLQLSGFLPEEPEEQVDLETSGFLPETHARSDGERHPTRAAHLGAAAERRHHTAVGTAIITFIVCLSSAGV